MITIIGAGKIAMGPLRAMMSKSVSLLGRCSTWGEFVGKELSINNSYDQKSDFLKIITANQYESMCEKDQLIVYSSFKEVMQVINNSECILISVGPNVEKVIEAISSTTVPIILVENDFELQLDLMQRYPNLDIRPAVVHSHSPLQKADRDTNVVEMSFDLSETELNVLDDDGKLRNIFLKEKINFCDTLFDLKGFHYQKFYGINIPHRLLCYLYLSSQMKKGNALDGLLHLPINRDEFAYLGEKYYLYTGVIAITVFLTYEEELKSFYGIADNTEGLQVHCNLMRSLAKLIAEATIDKGDLPSRIIKTGEQFTDRLIRTRRKILLLSESLKRKNMYLEEDHDQLVKKRKKSIKCLIILKTIVMMKKRGKLPIF